MGVQNKSRRDGGRRDFMDGSSISFTKEIGKVGRSSGGRISMKCP